MSHHTRESIAGVSIARLAEEFGTPTYIYDASIIDQQIEQLRAFDVIRYAQKANSNLTILGRMRQQGVLLDAVSAGEVLRAGSRLSTHRRSFSARLHGGPL